MKHEGDTFMTIRELHNGESIELEMEVVEVEVRDNGARYQHIEPTEESKERLKDRLQTIGYLSP